jgi:GrpB-like predicted nucleotidyltransferase (UPF0157 family)
MVRLGYEVMGDYGISGRRYFRKIDQQGNHTHHVHAFQVDHPAIKRHLAFRDYMIAHPDIAQAYGRLKQELALEYPLDSAAYMDEKDPFIKEHEARALAWWDAGGEQSA